MAPTNAPRFTFGLWTVGNPGRDPFGGPTREPLDPVDSVKKLGELGAWGISLHDEDLIPWGTPAAERDRIVARFKAALDEAGMGVGMGTTNLFGHAAFKDGAFTSNDRSVRRAAIGKSMRGIDLGAELDAEVFVFWGGREGTEVGAAKDPRDALERYREAVNVLVDYSESNGYGLRFGDRAQAERAARRHLPADRRPRAALHLHARPARARRPQPRGRARDDGGAVVPPRRRAGAVGGQALPHRPQRAADRALRPGLPLRRGGPQGGCSCSSGCSSAPATPGRGTSTRTPTATRTPRACGSSRPAACAPTRRWPSGRARFDELPEVKEALEAAASARPRAASVDGDDPDTLKAESDALDALAERGYYNERLDQLVVEVLMGRHT